MLERAGAVPFAHPIAWRVIRQGRFRHVVYAMEPGGLWVYVSTHWTRHGAASALRAFLRD